VEKTAKLSAEKLVTDENEKSVNAPVRKMIVLSPLKRTLDVTIPGLRQLAHDA
jgi:hypothetical protein